MAKLRLNKSMREDLIKFAQANCEVDETKKRKSAYAKAVPLVLKDVAKKYPKSDMEVLLKYEKAEKDTCLIGYSDKGQLLQFNCRRDDAPIVPKGYCSSRNYKWSAATAKVVEDYNFIVEQEQEAIRTVLRDYDALILNYQYADDLIEVWPAAQKCLQGYFNAADRNLPATLPQEAIERIRHINIGAAA